MNEPRWTDEQANDGVPDAASPADQIEARAEQAIERVQDEVDVEALDEDEGEPEEQLQTPDQARLYETTLRRNTHA
jgi:hypothetical protein